MRTRTALGVATTALLALATINGGAAAGADASVTIERTVTASDAAASAPVEHNHSAAMSDAAVRRLPVVEDGRAIGIVSLGDLAQVEDPDSALADISAEPPTD
jgi:CBS domain-containing protein